MKTTLIEPAGAAFDGMAETYDAGFTKTRLGAWLRSVVLARAEACFEGRERILEIGCGTGEDAIHLASRGHRVLAIDASRGMIDVARKKAAMSGCDGKVEFRHVRMEQLADAVKGESFDGAFSNFGALNCAAKMQSVIFDVAEVLNPRAALLWVLMGRYVPWEWAWFMSRMKFGKAFRRLSSDGVTWRNVQVYYPSPRQLEQALAPYFSVVDRRALGIILPPTYAANWLNHRPRLFTAFSRIERLLTRFPVLAAISDHYVIEAQRFATESRA
jgi:ubiquinone/menaquinone biosynthesis C-methylase UbiE